MAFTRLLFTGLCALALLGGPGFASAHEFILKPHKTTFAAGEKVRVEAQASHVFMVSEEIEAPSTVTLEVVQNGRKQTVALAEDTTLKALTGQLTLPAAAPALLVGHRLPQVWSDTTEGVLEGDRASLEKQGKRVLEVGKYEKFAKGLLNPAADDQLYKTVQGHDLELVLLTNPAELKAGDALTVQVLFMGKPVQAEVGITYDGFSDEEDQYVQKEESTPEGMAHFTVTKPGLWMVRTELTEKLQDGSADKRNLRCTYTFPVN